MAQATIKTNTSERYKNTQFLESLGEHCRRLRMNKGYSIDRLSREGDQLSPSVIQRLETGTGAVTVSTLFRYAQVLGLEPKDLLDFAYKSDTSAKEAPVSPANEPIAH